MQRLQDVFDLGHVAPVVELDFDVGAAAAIHHVAGDALEMRNETTDTLTVAVVKRTAEQALLLLAAPVVDDGEGRGSEVEDRIQAGESMLIGAGEIVVDFAAPGGGGVFLRFDIVDGDGELFGRLRQGAETPAVNEDDRRSAAKDGLSRRMDGVVGDLVECGEECLRALAGFEQLVQGFVELKDAGLSP